MKRNDQTFFIALGGMIAALSVVLMFLTALFPIAQFVFPAAAGILLIAAVFEMGEGRAALIFAAVAILAMLLPVAKDSAVYYLFFLGHYPILKSLIERLHNKVVKWIVKLLVFNVCAAGALFVSVKLLGLQIGELKYGIWLSFLFLNAAFVIYDIAVTNLAGLYAVRLRKILRRNKM